MNLSFLHPLAFEIHPHPPVPILPFQSPSPPFPFLPSATANLPSPQIPIKSQLMFSQRKRRRDLGRARSRHRMPYIHRRAHVLVDLEVPRDEREDTHVILRPPRRRVRLREIDRVFTRLLECRREVFAVGGGDPFLGFFCSFACCAGRGRGRGGGGGLVGGRGFAG